MKFEEIIKNKINQHQEAYDPKAWESLSAHLDKVAPVKVGGTSKLLMWLAGAAAFVGLVVGGVVYFNQDDKTPVVTQNSIQNEESALTEVKTDDSNELVNNNTNQKTTLDNQSVEEDNVKVVTEANPQKVQVAVSEQEQSTHELNRVSNGTSTTITSSQGNTIPNKTERIDFSKWSGNVCATDDYLFENPYSASVFLVNHEHTYEIKANTSIKSTEIAAGKYDVQYNEQKQNSLQIIQSGKISWTAKDMVYENGLPFIPVNVTSETSAEYTFFVNNEKLSVGSSAMIPAFNKGNQKVVVQTNQLGCESTLDFQVEIPKEYDLLAMTAFNTNSRDERNRVFLPYALYEREVEFEMQIIDPSTGQVIFITHSANQPWDGRNQKTGELVAPNQRFIWSVRLKEKAQFESKSIYQGLVIRVTD